HGFESVVLEDFLANLVPQIFLRVEFRGVRGEEMQHDVGGDYESSRSVWRLSTARTRRPVTLWREGAWAYRVPFSTIGPTPRVGGSQPLSERSQGSTTARTG